MMPLVEEASPQELDAQSLRLWRNGDVRGYNELIERHQRPLFQFIYRMIRDADDAKDVLQETFIRLYRSLARLQDDRSLRPWLFQTANNLCVDYLRKRKPGRIIAVDHQEPVTLAMLEQAQQSHRESKRPDELASERMLKEKVVAAIQQLPKKQRMMMTMRSCEGLSLKEIAEIVGCSENTVGTTLFAARKKLSKILKPLMQDLYGSAEC